MTSGWGATLRTDLAALIEGSADDDEALRRRLVTDLTPAPVALPDVVVQAASTDDVVAVVRYATDRSLPVYPRGAGLSFSRGYTPDKPGGILLDLSCLDKLVVIDADERFVIAEAGMSWQALGQHLAPTGLRTPYWGPLVGAAATLGATASQNSAWFGSARYGTLADSLLGLEVVTLGGELLRTGGLARDAARPFFRYHGPDLTGLFVGDNGAYGIKTRLAFQLIPTPAVRGVVTLGFDEFASAAAVLDDVTTAGLVSDVFTYDRASAALLDGLAAADADGWTVQCGLEARSRRQLDAQSAAILGFAYNAGGRQLASDAGDAFMRAPFDHLARVLLGPDNQVSLPVMAVTSYDRAGELQQALETELAVHAAEFARHSITSRLLCVGMPNAVLFELFLLWPDAPGPVRAARTGVADAADAGPDAPAARALVMAVRDRLRDVFEAAGCFHFQLGRYYRTESTLDPVAFQALRRLKRIFDPTDILNPGVLGL